MRTFLITVNVPDSVSGVLLNEIINAVKFNNKHETFQEHINLLTDSFTV